MLGHTVSSKIALARTVAVGTKHLISKVIPIEELRLAWEGLFCCYKKSEAIRDWMEGNFSTGISWIGKYRKPQ